MSVIAVLGGLGFLFARPAERIWDYFFPPGPIVVVVDDSDGSKDLTGSAQGSKKEPQALDPWHAADLPYKLSQALRCTWREAPVESLLRPLGTPDVEHDHGGVYHYGWTRKGIDLVFDHEYRLLEVELQTGRLGTYRSFDGTWPRGVQSWFDKAQVLGRVSPWPGRQLRPYGDCDCYLSHDDRWCVTFTDDGAGTSVLLNFILTKLGSSPGDGSVDLNEDPSRHWPLPPPLPIGLTPVQSVGP